MPRGGKREGAGRPKGSRNAATIRQQATISELAREHTQEAIDALVDVCRNGEGAARVSAANALLDRGYGKPMQAIDLSNSDGTLAPQIDASKLETEVLQALLAARVSDDESSTVH